MSLHWDLHAYPHKSEFLHHTNTSIFYWYSFHHVTSNRELQPLQSDLTLRKLRKFTSHPPWVLSMKGAYQESALTAGQRTPNHTNPMQNSPSGFEELPNELLERILTHCDLHTRKRTRSIRKWFNDCSLPILFRDIYHPAKNTTSIASHPVLRQYPQKLWLSNDMWRCEIPPPESASLHPIYVEVLISREVHARRHLLGNIALLPKDLDVYTEASSRLKYFSWENSCRLDGKVKILTCALLKKSDITIAYARLG